MTQVALYGPGEEIGPSVNGLFRQMKKPILVYPLVTSEESLGVCSHT